MLAGTDIRSRNASCGFTLIELIITIVLIGLLAAVGTTMISDTFDTTRMVDSSQASVARVRYAMERLEREIREGNKVDSVSATGMTVTKIDGTSIAIASSSGNLSVGGALLIANDVIANPGSSPPPLFTYLDKGLDETAITSDIRFVQIYLTVRDDPVKGSGQTISQRSRIALRN